MHSSGNQGPTLAIRGHPRCTLLEIKGQRWRRAANLGAHLLERAGALVHATAAACALRRGHLLPTAFACIANLLGECGRDEHLPSEGVVVDLRLGHAVEALGAPAAVADGRARKVREAAALVDLVHQHRKVCARVRLARDVKGTGHERREALEEGDEGLVGVLRGGFVGVDALAFARAVREANALGLLDGKERAHLGPPELIVVQRRRGGWRGGLGRRIARGGHRLELAELGEHADHAARTRAAVDPHDHRIGGWVAL